MPPALKFSITSCGLPRSLMRLLQALQLFDARHVKGMMGLDDENSRAI